MKVGLAYNLKHELANNPDLPDDINEEFDCEETVEAIERVLNFAGYEVFRLGAGKDFVELLLRNVPDIVFNIAEGFGSRSREAHIPAILEFYGIPFTGSDPLVLSLTLEKALTKRIVSSLGVKTPQFMVIRDIKQSLNDCPLPAVVKPLYEGSSMGIRLGSKVDTPEELEKKVRQIIQAYKEPVLVEKFLPGSEFTVGVLGDGRGLELIGVMEIVPKGMKVSEFLYSIEVKRNWRQMVEYVVNPHWFSGRIKDRIKSDVLKIAETLGIVDFARFDFRFDENGEPNFLEVNPLPGLNPIQSDFPMLARAVGINYDELIIRIIESARKRYVFENSDSIQQGLKKSVG